MTLSRGIPRAEEFLDRYVQDGRVVRLDQGGDTVSEGQAYAMLLAVALNDEATFDSVWEWTADHLQQPGGEIAWRWIDGVVPDMNSAPDADLDIAVALVLGAEQFGREELIDEAERVSRAILDRSTATQDGRRVLTAGPWVVDPVVVNASYFDPSGYELLADRLSEPRWGELSRDLQSWVDALQNSAGLIADWSIAVDGRLEPSGPPHDPGANPSFGLDAVRLPIRFAASCDPYLRELAARLALPEALLAQPSSRYWLPDGTPDGSDPHPVTFVGAAAVEHLRGGDPTPWLEKASELATERPFYYGDAWVALGTVILTTDRLDRC